ncbi:hypothetical protein LPJ72_000228 [Coemansia sp. Benny D160-2]|nr:hypothetical protein LPJ72_000228 [Coemansia sp. Benny D160-2]
MTVQTGRENAANAGDRAPGEAGSTPDLDNTSPAIPAKKSSKSARFPGVGRTLSDAPTESHKHNSDDGDEEEDEDEDEELSDDANDNGAAGKGQDDADRASDFDEDEYEEAYLSEDDGDLDDEEYSSSEDEDTARGGSSVYNLRSPALKRKMGSGSADASDDEGAGPSLRTRQKTNVTYDEFSDENDDDANDSDSDSKAV